MSGKAGKSGPRKGNVNAVKTGTKIAKTRLVVGELPKQLLSVRREGRSYRRAIEAATLDTKGKISTNDAHHIDTASAATIHAGICRWLLRNKLSAMSTADVLNCSKSLVQAKQARDIAIKAIGLEVEPEPIDLKTYLTLDAEKGNGE